MEQSNKELIKEIADLFEDYEESYVPGEWESFLKQKKKKYPFFSPWLKIAAILFLIVSVLPFNLSDLLQREGNGGAVAKQDAVSSDLGAQKLGRAEKAAGSAEKQIASVKSIRETGQFTNPLLNRETVLPTKLPAVIVTPEDSNGVQSFQNQQIVSSGARILRSSDQRERIINEHQVNSVADHKGNITAPAVNQAVAQTALKTTGADHPGQYAKDSLNVPKKAKLSTSEFLIAESKNATKTEKKKQVLSKWDFGLQVMPTATRTNMNFGGGLITAYHISDKLSLSSGITLMQLGAGEHVPAATPSVAAEAAYSAVVKTSAERRQLLAVDANIKAIDIPLGLVYKVNKHYYTSAGVSYFNVLSEKRNNTYSETVPVNKLTRDPSTGAELSYSALETQQVDEEATDRPLKGNSYLGFFNFSIGRRQNIFKQYNFQIEPFIKVPIGKLSAQDLNLMNSGIKFQLSF